MDHDYTAMCDISSTVSCSRVLTSKYGTGFGIVAPLFGGDSFLNQKNALYGVMGYTVLALIQLSHTRCSANVSFPIAILLNVMSFYLIIILVILRAACLVCMAIYVVNALFLYFTVKRRRALVEVDNINNNKKRN